METNSRESWIPKTNTGPFFSPSEKYTFYIQKNFSLFYQGWGQIEVDLLSYFIILAP